MWRRLLFGEQGGDEDEDEDDDEEEEGSRLWTNCSRKAQIRGSEWNSPNHTILDEAARARNSVRERKRPRVVLEEVAAAAGQDRASAGDERSL